MLDVAKAKKELKAKTLLDIERATATTWGSRAAACYQLAHEAKDEATRSTRLQEATGYRLEALEHAAMTEDLKFLRALMRDIQAHRRKAEASIKRSSAA